MSRAETEKLAQAIARTMRAQRDAARPDRSVLVAANAGTGKTKVLVERVLRLLLAGTSPDRLLCLTYTKAAAAEMANRLFTRLAGWTVAAETALAAELGDLLGGAAAPAEIKRARTLFAIAVETPGGLKVQTIHAFCERVLKRFPLEAGVPPQFTVLDEESQRAAIADSIAVALGAAATGSAEQGEALARIAAHAAEARFESIIGECVRERAHLLELSRNTATGETDFDGLAGDLRAALGVRPASTAGSIAGEIAGLLDPGGAQSIVNILAGGSANDRNAAARLAPLVGATAVDASAEALIGFLLTADGTPRKAIMTKSLSTANPGIASRLDSMAAEVERLVVEAQALDVAQASIALLRIASDVLQLYRDAKASRAALDYDDLILSTAGLMSSSTAAQWVLYKLDEGLDHILVDEAQDTAPAQWQVIERLAAEFFAGSGAREANRTIFTVGDRKQSIYSFQGARPESFAETSGRFEAMLDATGGALARIPLTLSFRSAEPILEAVDRVFASAARTPGVVADDGVVRHELRRAGQGGLVELWPLEALAEAAPSEPWDPLGEEPATDPAERLAARIGRTIRGWLDRGEMLVSHGRPIRPGDILILLRKRRPLAPRIVKSLKGLGVPVSGADRLRVTEHIAVEDLMALGDFLLLPEDDLALAGVLKSPLCGLDDDDLFAIGWQRRGSLWQALLRHAETDERFMPAAASLKRWRSAAGYAPPFEFFAGVIEREANRGKFLARLGAEAGDALDELLGLAIRYDAENPPSLQGFLWFLRRTTPEIRRDMELGRDEVRVMTVHGAKGLEAPIVFLPDTTSAGRAPGGAALVRLEQSVRPPGAPAPLVWAIKGAGKIAIVQAARGATAAAEQAEYHRLLYVAMTRARDRLYVAGCETRRAAPGCWYELVKDGLDGTLTPATADDGTTVLRRLVRQSPATAPDGVVAEPAAHSAPEPLPAWARTPARREEMRTIPLAPSRLAPLDEEDAAPSSEALQSEALAREPAAERPSLLAGGDRFKRGLVTHALLQFLPDVALRSRKAAAERYLKHQAPELSKRQRDAIAAETLAVLEAPGFAALFSATSAAEVPIVAELPSTARIAPPLRITGTIDRLAVNDAEVLLVDFKTNRPPPETETGVARAYLLQLAAYRLALAAIFPGRPIRAALLWTDGPRLMPISDHILDTAAAEILSGSPWP